jgi:NADH-quinone oxidoreductase subunit N
MTITDFICLAPLIILASAPVVMMITLTVSRNYHVIYGFSIMVYLLAFGSLFFINPFIPHQTGDLLVFDRFSVLLLAVIILSGLIITLFSNEYFKNHGDQKEEYFIILFIANLGASVLVVANNFVTFFLGLETLSISLYILIAYLKYRDYSVEAGVKFLVIASVSTAFMLFGMALLYADSGSLSFNGVADIFINRQLTFISLAGFAMILAGIAFKLALVPFHMWAPDVYQGAPAPVTSFIATISKGAVVALTLRLFMTFRVFDNHTLFILISTISILSMFTGNFLALKQMNIKRLLAFSSIAHMGYLSVTFLMYPESGIQAALFYLITYIITTLAVFGVIAVLSTHYCDMENIVDLKGLFFSKPWLAVVMSLCMFSLAGIPLTAGFMAKFYIVTEGMRSGLWLLSFSLIINTIISLYYYLTVIRMMFSRSEESVEYTISFSGKFILAVLSLGILFLGIIPSLLANFLKEIIM